MRSVLIVEDDIAPGVILKTWLGKKGFNVPSVSDITHAQRHINTQPTDLIPSDLRLPDHNGIRLLKWASRKELHIPLIIMAGYVDTQSMIQAMKLGAQDYIAGPVNPEELFKKITEAPQARESPLPQVAPYGKSPKTRQESHPYLEGESNAAKQLYNYVSLVVPTNMLVLISGANGTGKEYVAHRTHQLSKHCDKPFIAIGYGFIPKKLAVSEFFGHIKGSFAGALSNKTDAFVAANGGTIFLDEIDNLSYEIQVQLLRALQERRICPVGSNTRITVDIRLVSATNENLEQATERGTFREDLYHRISEFTLRTSTLKGRGEDILLFANFFLDQANKEFNKQLTGLDVNASKALLEYHQSGNLRQMKDVIKHTILLAQGSFIDLMELGNEIQETQPSTSKMALRNGDTEKEHIMEALQQTSNNKSRATQLLDIDRRTLYNKLKLCGIDL